MRELEREGKGGRVRREGKDRNSEVDPFIAMAMIFSYICILTMYYLATTNSAYSLI